MTSPASTDSAPPQLSAGPRPAPGPAADEGLARRLRALACTAPLHDLDARKANLAGEYSVYAMAEVALAAIDLVTLNMDFDTGADHDQIVARLIPRIAAQAPRRPVAEHERVARWVLENLINVGSVDRGFRAVYGTFAPDGAYVRRDYDFKLIEEVPGYGGSVYLRTTDEAVNVLVGALDTDVTSAQIAAEVKLEVLISRGRLADAQLAAEQARYRTVQYAETLRRALDATRRNVRAVDWLQRRARHDRRGARPRRRPLPPRERDPHQHPQGPRRVRGPRAQAARRRARRHRQGLHPPPHPAAVPAAGGRARCSAPSRTGRPSPPPCRPRGTRPVRAARRAACCRCPWSRRPRVTDAFFARGHGAAHPRRRSGSATSSTCC